MIEYSRNIRFYGRILFLEQYNDRVGIRSDALYSCRGRGNIFYLLGGKMFIATWNLELEYSRIRLGI